MTITIRCAGSLEEFAAVETELEYIADTELYLRRLFDTGCSRLDWCFIAETHVGEKARIALWSSPESEKPRDFVLLNADWRNSEVGVGSPATALLRHIEDYFRSMGAESIGHCQDVPPREPQWQTAQTARQQLLERYGYEAVRHTLRYRFDERRVGQHETEGSIAKVELVPITASDEALLVSLVAEVASASHDQLDRDGCAEHGAREHARRLIQDLRDMRIDAGWWRIAYEQRADGKFGDAVGFILPAASADMGTIGYVGVRPAYRGKQHIDALHDYASKVLANAKFPRVIADTDVTNVPMSRAFERNGWSQFGERIEWSKKLSLSS